MESQSSILATAAKCGVLILLMGMLTACPQLQQSLNSFLAAPPGSTEPAPEETPTDDPAASAVLPMDSLVPTDGTVNATNGVVGELGAEVPQEPSVLEGVPPNAEEIPQP